MPRPSFSQEKNFWKQNYQYVIGIDEVGRGCLAGPVVAAAVMFFPHHKKVRGVHDSKLLSSKQREELDVKLRKQTEYIGIGLSTVEEINTIGLNPSIFLAMDRAVQQLQVPSIDILLIDGSFQPTFPSIIPGHIEMIIKGDQRSYSIAAASIVAKVYRDSKMHELATQYPHYEWQRNVGYGTKAHREAIKTHGLCKHHRPLFCRKVLATNTNTEEESSFDSMVGL